MRVLVDTHLLLWSAGWPSGPGANSPLPAEAAAVIGDPLNQPVFSVASLWEVAIKTGLGRADFTLDPRLLRRGLLDNGYEELPIIGHHAVAVLALPPLHKDPFDRMLVAQATAEGLVLLTADRMVASYPGSIRLV